MKNKEKIKKTKTTNRIIEYGILALFVGLLFTTNLKAEVFGFVQRSFLKVGLFNTNALNDDNLTTEDTSKSYESLHLILEDQNGRTVKISDLKNKVVFINFWATWCPPCIAEMPNINKLYESYQNDDEVVFLMISLDENFNKAKKFLDNKDFKFDIYHPKSSLPKELESRGIPNTFVLGKNGKIEYSKMGMGNYNTPKFKNFLEDLKAES